MEKNSATTVDDVLAANVSRFRARILAWSQADLADRVNGSLPQGDRPWTAQTVMDVEGRRRGPTGKPRTRKVRPTEIVALARAFGVPVSALFLPPPTANVTVGSDLLSRNEFAWQLFELEGEAIPPYVESAEPYTEAVRQFGRLTAELESAAESLGSNELPANIEDLAEALLRRAYERKPLLAAYIEDEDGSNAARALARIVAARAKSDVAIPVGQ